MAKKSGNLAAMRGRAARTAAVATGAAAPASAAPTEPKKRTSIAQFGREVRAEARKITWTTRKETWITSVMVLIMVVISSAFLFVVDLGLGGLIAQFLKLANAG